MIGNASSHRHIKDLPVLSNAEVIDLRKNTTSCLQPLDAGVISSLEKRYRRKQCQRALCFLEEENIQDFYEVKILVACKTITSIWIEVEGRIIFNCWEKQID